MRAWQIDKKAEGLYFVKNARFGFTFAYSDAIKGGGLCCTNSEYGGKRVTSERLLNLIELQDLTGARDDAQQALLTHLSKKTAAQ
jgi:hypothetical protein